MSARQPGPSACVGSLAPSDNPDEPLLLSTVDTVAGPNVYADFIEQARLTTSAVTLALTEPGEDEKPLLVRMQAGDSRIIAFGEGEYATAGVYAVRPIILREAEQARRDGIEALRKFLGRLLERGYELQGIPIPKSIDVDRPADIALAERLLGNARI
jgi:NDP-sugar pyrophosphorylase family protein